MAPKYSSVPNGEEASGSNGGREPLLRAVEDFEIDSEDEGSLEKWASPDRWQTSTIKTTTKHTKASHSIESSDSEATFREKRHSSNLEEPGSPNEWSNAADAPLLANTDDNLEDEETLEEEEKISAPPAAGSAEYKVALSHFARIFTYSTWEDRVVLVVATIASICTGVMLPIMNVVFGQLVGAFSEFYDPNSHESKEKFTSIINQNVWYIIYLFLARLVLDYVAILGFRMVSIRISAAIRLDYMHALFSQPISVLDTLPAGQTAAIITITANILQIGISERVSMFFQGISLVITALIIAFQYSWQLTMVTSSGLLFIVIFYTFTLPKLVRMLKEVEDADRMSSSVASEVFSSIRMVAACGAEDKMKKKYAGWVEESKRRGLLMSPLVAMQQSPVFFAIHATFALSFWYAIKLYLDQKISSVTSMIIVLMSIMTIVMSIGSIAAPISAAARAAGAAGVFFSIIDAPRPKTHGLLAPNVSCQQDLVLENVNFAYPVRHDVKVLENLSVTFPAGKQTAIVGASGSGKSTIVGLIERWYELDGDPVANPLTLYFRSGTIKVGGTNLHEIDLNWWRSQIGLVQQEPFLFNDTIYKNVEYGLIGTEWEFESFKVKARLVRQACKEAFADEFIARLPEGYKTTVGEAGIKLSGGQRQRIAIARSIVKKPSILILDEATSAIDVRGEKIVQAALDAVSKGRTTITIAHRLSTIMKADNIVVLQKGKVVQQGTHERLLEDREGSYWGLVNAQQLSSWKETKIVVSEVQSANMEKIAKYSPLKERFSSVDLEANARSDLPVSHSSFGSFSLFFWEQKHQSAWYGIMLLGCLGAGAAFPLHSFLFAKLISIFNLWGASLQEQTNFWCLMFTFLAIGVGISYYLLGYSSNTVSFIITSNYRQEYFQNILKKPVSFHDHPENSVGSLTSLVASDPTQLQQLLGINMAIVLISIFNISGCVAISFYFGFKLTLITIITALPIILGAGFFRLRYETQFEKMNHDVFAESSKFATEAIGAFRTVSSLTLEDEIVGRYARLLGAHTRGAWLKARWSTLVFAMSDSISLLCMAFVLWYGGQLLASHEYLPFNYLVIYLAIVQGSTSAGQSLSFGPNIAQAMAAAKRIRNMRPQAHNCSPSTLIDMEDIEVDEKEDRGVKIELRNVSFKYPTRDTPVLDGLNMTIEKGQFAAIVGPSGCGKTSIISLLERFYTTQSGSILLSSTPINNISLPTYRNAFSLVSQEPSLFSGSIRSNILLGCHSPSTISTSHLHSICKQAEIHDFIISLPQGYSTPIGAKGVALSGGQKQRIAIARALIRDPRVLLLDEATSNLDSETEREVQMVLEREAKARGRTTIVVAHRLATVQRADVIFVLGDGRVVEQGNHRQLLELRGLYWQMCEAQALDR